MIIGFSRYGSGGSGAALDYLTGYLVSGGVRAIKPEVVRGDPALVGAVIDSLPYQRRYSSGVLSFAAEDHVTSKIQEDVIDRFEAATFAGIPKDRRSIVWIKHTDKGRTELHFVAARVDLGTGKAMNIAPPTPASRLLLDTLRESINTRYGFRDPSNPDFAQTVHLPNHVAKLAAQAKRIGKSPKSDIRETIANQVAEAVTARTITNRAGVLSFLEQRGFTITRAGINYITVATPDGKDRIRLKGNVFREHFQPRDLLPQPKRDETNRLQLLELRLAELTEKRAEYNRARYCLTTPVETMENFNDRTGIQIVGDSQTTRDIARTETTSVRVDDHGFGEAAQGFIRSNRLLERSCEQFDAADRALTSGFEQAVTDMEQFHRFDNLIEQYGESGSRRVAEPMMELELER